MLYREITKLLKGQKYKIETGILGYVVTPKNFFESVEIAAKLMEVDAKVTYRIDNFYIKR